jgi:hypothetical protein
MSEILTKDDFSPGDIVSITSLGATVISNETYEVFSLPRVDKNDLIMLLEHADNLYTQNYESIQTLGPCWDGGWHQKYTWWSALLGDQLIFIDTSWGVRLRSKMCA